MGSRRDGGGGVLGENCRPSGCGRKEEVNWFDLLTGGSNKREGVNIIRFWAVGVWAKGVSGSGKWDGLDVGGLDYKSKVHLVCSN